MIYSHMCKDFFIEKIDRNEKFNMQNSHFHDHYEIYYLLEGKREYLIGDRVFKVESGDLILIPKGELHMTRYSEELKHSRFLINFTYDYFQTSIPSYAKEDLLKLFEVKKFSVKEEERKAFEAILLGALREYETKDKYSKEILEKYLYEVLVYIRRNLYFDEMEFIIHKIDDEKIMEAVTYILDNYKTNITLEDISNYCYLSKYHFSRKFKEVTGFTFIQYLTFVRIKESIKLLLETKKTITEVSYDCGFKDSNYFGDIFKKYVGVSPLKYRNTIK